MKIWLKRRHASQSREVARDHASRARDMDLSVDRGAGRGREGQSGIPAVVATIMTDHAPETEIGLGREGNMVVGTTGTSEGTIRVPEADHAMIQGRGIALPHHANTAHHRLADMARGRGRRTTISADDSTLARRHAVYVRHRRTVESKVDARPPETTIDGPQPLLLSKLLVSVRARRVHSHSKVHQCPDPPLCPAPHHLCSVGNSNHSKVLLFPIYLVSWPLNLPTLKRMRRSSRKPNGEPGKDLVPRKVLIPNH